MKKHKNREYHHGEYEGAQDTQIEDQDLETGRDQQDETGEYTESKDQQDAPEKGKKKDSKGADQADENDEDVFDQQEEGEAEEEQEEGDEEGAGDEESADAEDAAKGGFDIKKIAQKVMDYINGEEATADKETILKYVSVAILAIYGVRKGGLIGGLLLSAATGLVAKYVQESIKDKQQGEEETEEEEQPEHTMAPAR